MEVKAATAVISHILSPLLLGKDSAFIIVFNFWNSSTKVMVEEI